MVDITLPSPKITPKKHSIGIQVTSDMESESEPDPIVVQLVSTSSCLFDDQPARTDLFATISQDKSKAPFKFTSSPVKGARKKCKVV